MKLRDRYRRWKRETASTLTPILVPRGFGAGIPVDPKWFGLGAVPAVGVITKDDEERTPSSDTKVESPGRPPRDQVRGLLPGDYDEDGVERLVYWVNDDVEIQIMNHNLGISLADLPAWQLITLLEEGLKMDLSQEELIDYVRMRG